MEEWDYQGCSWEPVVTLTICYKPFLSLAWDCAVFTGKRFPLLCLFFVCLFGVVFVVFSLFKINLQVNKNPLKQQLILLIWFWLSNPLFIAYLVQLRIPKEFLSKLTPLYLKLTLWCAVVKREHSFWDTWLLNRDTNLAVLAELKGCWSLNFSLFLWTVIQNLVLWHLLDRSGVQNKVDLEKQNQRMGTSGPGL